ncbi:MAG: hypothetical protein NC079_00580 [Clostridium sp.]|nr:hypothetical protein [Acetatifactor muris]MCM1527468.1 hypothetical protein [Bacteroides sp.]MCM1562086.1 hypothetical protein [Clostridium sp.]
MTTITQTTPYFAPVCPHTDETIARAEQRYRAMGLEELKRRKLISNTDGRPSAALTDEKWQKEFYLRKLFITPCPDHINRPTGHYSKESGLWNEETRGQYSGPTNWQRYCAYISDVSDNIRAGRKDYCYYIFQIMELAKFYPDTLRTRYCDGYWEVWLDIKPRRNRRHSDILA